MTEVHDDREQSWRDQLPADELAVTDRLRSMSVQMQSAWLGVEIFRVRKELADTKVTLARTVVDTNKATADAIAGALRAITPTIINGKKAWTVNPAVATAFGAAMVGAAYAIARLLGAA